MEFRLLDKINTPADLRALANKDIPILAEEIRRFLINTVEAHGGHLASNLGAVEFTLAIHRVFESPKDRIIFDVGHQSYVHKLITGRRERFSALRKTGGLSGFTLTMFEEGTALIRTCTRLLDEAEQKVIKLKKGPDGEPMELPLDEEEA